MLHIRDRLAIACGALLAWAACSAWSQEVGDVVEFKSFTPLRVGKEQRDEVPSGTKLLVKAKNDPWLWVEYKQPGWVKTFDVTVVPMAGQQWAALASPEQREAVTELWKLGAAVEFSPAGDVVGVQAAFRSLADGKLKHVEPLANLRFAMLIFCDLRDADLAYLARHERLEALFLGGNKVTAKGLAHLAGKSSLRGLYLMLSTVDDDALAQVATLENLEELRLTQTSVTDAGLSHLAGLKKLRSLELGGNPISNAGAKHLAAVTSLVQLDLTGTKLDDAGLAELAPLEGLTALQLGSCKSITDAGLAHLKKFTHLTELSLNNIGTLTDAAIPMLAEFAKLSKLDLSGNRLTDAGLAKLEKLSQLAELRIGANGNTPRGLAALRKALPKTKIQD